MYHDIYKQRTALRVGGKCQQCPNAGRLYWVQMFVQQIPEEYSAFGRTLTRYNNKFITKLLCGTCRAKYKASLKHEQEQQALHVQQVRDELKAYERQQSNPSQSTTTSTKSTTTSTTPTT